MTCSELPSNLSARLAVLSCNNQYPGKEYGLLQSSNPYAPPESDLQTFIDPQKVWRDDKLLAHRAYADEIEAQLDAARAVVVIWSADAIRSEWVRSEADRARKDRKLVQLSVDGSRLPMPFDQIQCAELSGWQGDSRAAGWRTVIESVLQSAPHCAIATASSALCGIGSLERCRHHSSAFSWA